MLPAKCEMNTVEVNVVAPVPPLATLKVPLVINAAECTGRSAATRVALPRTRPLASTDTLAKSGLDDQLRERRQPRPMCWYIR